MVKTGFMLPCADDRYAGYLASRSALVICIKTKLLNDERGRDMRTALVRGYDWGKR